MIEIDIRKSENLFIMSAEGAVAALGQGIALERLGPLATGSGQVIDLDMRVWFNEELKTSHYEVPSELGISFRLLLFYPGRPRLDRYRRQLKAS